MSKPLPTVEAFNEDLPSVLTELQEGHYLFIIADAKRAFLFLFQNEKMTKEQEIMDPGVRQKIKSNQGELNGRNTKLEHRRDNQMREHLTRIMDEAVRFTKDMHINGVFLGGHQPLFNEVENALPPALKKLYRSSFVTELNIPREDLIKHCQKVYDEYRK